jgi:hypothetical protein
MKIQYDWFKTHCHMLENLSFRGNNVQTFIFKEHSFTSNLYTLYIVKSWTYHICWLIIDILFPKWVNSN